MQMEEQMLETIGKYKMFNKNDKVIVAVSGGPDSVCLLHLLYRLRQKLGISLFAAHLDHKFRGKESEADSVFVQRFTKQLGIPCFTQQVDVPKYIEETGLSPEEAAREVRYRFFEKVFKQTNGDKIALGHNLNDQVETVLMRFLRGTGIKGLSGIPPVRDVFVRPLIEVSREEIMNYLRRNRLEYRIDKTNLKPIYERNKLRLKLIPLLEKEYNPNLKKTLNNMAVLMRDDSDFIQKQTLKVFKEIVEIRGEDRLRVAYKKFDTLHNAIKTRLLRLCYKEVSKTLKDLSYSHIKDTMEFIEKGKTGASISLPKGVIVSKSYRGFGFYTKTSKKQKVKYSYKFLPGETVHIKEVDKKIKSQIMDISQVKTPFENDPSVVYVDLSQIKGNTLTIRNRKPGDRFRPLGMKGTKKLKDFFIDEKIPAHERDSIPLVVEGDTIVWVAGLRLSEDYKITSKTTRVLKLTIK